MMQYKVNTLRSRQNGHHFPVDTSKYIFFNVNIWISIKISLKFAPKGPINNIPSLVQIMACCHPGDKPLSVSMMVSLLMHICVTRPQWVNPLGSDTHGYITLDIQWLQMMIDSIKIWAFVSYGPSVTIGLINGLARVWWQAKSQPIMNLYNALFYPSCHCWLIGSCWKMWQ